MPDEDRLIYLISGFVKAAEEELNVLSVSLTYVSI